LTSRRTSSAKRIVPSSNTVSRSRALPSLGPVSRWIRGARRPQWSVPGQGCPVSNAGGWLPPGTGVVSKYA